MKYIILPLIIFYLSCIPQKRKLQEVPKELVNIIKSIPPKEISAFSSLEFEFFIDIPEAQLRQELNSSAVFKFDPEVKGKVFWERKDKLVFYPFEPFEPGKEYKCQLNLSMLSYKLNNFSPLFFAFKIHENEIFQVSHRFEKDISKKEPNANLFYLKFLMTKRNFKDEDLRDGIILFLNKDKLEFELNKIEKYYELKAPFFQPEDGGKIKVLFSKEKLKTFENLELNFPLAPFKKFILEKLETKWEEDGGKIYIYFSAPVLDENIKSYVLIEPFLDYSYSITGNLLKISGNFDIKKNYKLIIIPGLKSIAGDEILEEQQFFLAFKNFPPNLMVSTDKIYLSSKSGRNLRFKTINLKELQITCYFIPLQNLIFFLQNYEEGDGYGEYWNIRRFGKEIYSEKIKLPEIENKWIEQDLNINIPKNMPDKGLFFIRFNFTKNDILWECGAEAEEEYYYESYYNNPCNYGYYYRNGTKDVVVVISDISIVALRDQEKWNVWAYNVTNAEPEEGVEIEGYEYQNLLIQRTKTDKKGYATLPKENLEFIIAKKGENLSFIKVSSPSPTLEPFDLKGYYPKEKEGLMAFTYTERGVYRPSDEIYLTTILRQEGKPVDLPLRCVLKNPLGQDTMELVQKEQLNGVYVFKLKTDIDSPTGLWYANIYAGKEIISSHPIRVEMIVPPKIKPEIEIEKESYTIEEFPVKIRFSSIYLFGAPSSNLNFSLKTKLKDEKLQFEKWKNFKFSSEIYGYEKDFTILAGVLDENGKGEANFKLTKEPDFPPLIKADILLEVNEKGGRPAYDKKEIKIFPYKYYIGVGCKEDFFGRYGESIEIPFVLVDVNGDPVPEREVEVNIYFSSYHWWYEVRNIKEILSSYYTKLKNSFKIKTKKGEEKIKLNFDEPYGTYLIELKEVEGGEKFYFSIPVSCWGLAKKEVGGSFLNVSGVKDRYEVGEEAKLEIKTPEKGTLFYCIVKGNKILDWDEMPLKNNKTFLNIKIREEMIPNSYVFIQAIQDIKSKNDIPLRAYSILPLNVNPLNAKLDFEIISPEEVKPGEKFDLKIKLLNKREGVFTVAIVDSGILNLTNYKVPNPFNFFYQKIAFSLKYLDSFDYFYGIPDIPAEYIYKIGGEVPAQRLLTSPVKSNPFPPIVFFKGPFYVKNEEKIEFKVPNYLGELKILAVGTFNGAYGSKEKAIKVIDEIIPYATFPRACSPGDSFEVPVQIFIQKSKNKKIIAEIYPSNYFEVLKEKKIEIPFKEGEFNISFYLKAKEDKIGEGNVKIIFRSGKEYEIEQLIPIHPISPYQSKEDFYVLEKGKEMEIKVPLIGFIEKAKAGLIISKFENLPVKSIYENVMAFPFGCIEQTSSKLFATIFLRDLLIAYKSLYPDLSINQLDRTVEYGFRVLQNFLLPEGSFAFWPYDRFPASIKTSLYVTHLILEANKRGFPLKSFLDETINYQKRKARERIYDIEEQAYRLFLLAYAGEPDYSSMNLLVENYIEKMENDSKIMLAAAFSLANDEKKAKEILEKVKKIEEIQKRYEYFYCNSGIYGKYLYFLSKIDINLATDFLKKISGLIKKTKFWSTHDSGWYLAGISSYFNSLNLSELIKARVSLPDKEIKIEEKGFFYSVDLKDYLNKKIKIINEGDGTLFLNLFYSGIPLEVPSKKEERNMALDIKFYDENKNPIETKSFSAGSLIYEKVELKIFNEENFIAISQILPAGFEPVNFRILGIELPQWASSSKFSYMDIRDDRVNIFIDKTEYQKYFEFYIPLKVVTKGNFIYPPAIAQAMYNPDFYSIFPVGRVQVE